MKQFIKSRINEINFLIEVEKDQIKDIDSQQPAVKYSRQSILRKRRMNDKVASLGKVLKLNTALYNGKDLY